MDAKTTLTRENIKYAVIVILGCLLSALAINVFIINAHLYSGGVSGIAVLAQYAFKIPTGYFILIANIPLLTISYFKLNKRFTIYSTIGTLSYSLFLIWTKNMQYLVNMNDPLIYCIYGGILNGLGAGLAYANHGSVGGFNIITMLIKKKHDSYDVGQIGFFANLIIVAVGTVLHGIPIALYTMLSMYITSFVTDKVIHGVSRKKLLFIITDKEKEVCDYITTYMHRGATILNGQALTGKDRKVIYCIVHVSRLPQLKFEVQAIDNDALISIIDASEVDGKGFTTSIL